MHLSRRTLVFAATSLVLLPSAARFLIPSARAAAPATPDEAKAMVERAAAHLKEVGIDKAMADFNDPAAGYVDRELFVVIYGPDSRVLCAYGTSAMVGRDGTQFKDVSGKEFGKEIMALGRNGGSGWVEYHMTNPLTKKVGLKRSYVMGVGDYVLLVGALIG